MKRRTVIGAVGGLALLGGGYAGLELFAPERATRVNEDRTGGSSGGTSDGGSGDNAPGAGDGDDRGGVEVLKTGEFVGKDNHRCSGTIELARDDGGLFLQFRDYEQTQGPDVFCYLTPDADPDTTAEIDAGTKVLIDGGADGGEITKTGTFAQPIPDSVAVEDVNGVGIWCDRFSVPFGAATLSPSGEN